MEACWQMIAWGFAGGCAAELLQWFRIRKELYRGIPDWAKSWWYWIVTIGMVGMGTLLVSMYGIESNPILAFNVGASAPLILKSLVEQVPQIDPGHVES